MDIIYEFIFSGLTDATQNSKISRNIRILAAILVSIIFIISILTLEVYDFFAVDQGIFKRLMSVFLLLVIAGYYIHLLAAMKKTSNNYLNKDNNYFILQVSMTN